jgi:hypothetical protein
MARGAIAAGSTVRLASALGMESVA